MMLHVLMETLKHYSVTHSSIPFSGRLSPRTSLSMNNNNNNNSANNHFTSSPSLSADSLHFGMRSGNGNCTLHSQQQGLSRLNWWRAAAATEAATGSGNILRNRLAVTADFDGGATTTLAEVAADLMKCFAFHCKQHNSWWWSSCLSVSANCNEIESTTQDLISGPLSFLIKLLCSMYMWVCVFICRKSKCQTSESTSSLFGVSIQHPPSRSYVTCRQQQQEYRIETHLIF